jgi:hypothetical protein
MTKRKPVDPPSVKKCLVAKNNDHQDAEAIESGQNPKVGPPVKFEKEQTGEKGPEIWSNQERRCPDINLARSFVEEEQVVDY